MRIHAYRALRPRPDLAGRVASAPYDTLDTAEAAALAKDNPMSFLHVNHSEIDLPAGTDAYSPAVYDKAAANLRAFVANGWLVREDRPLMYLYSQTMGDHTQTGLVACCHIDDYVDNVIKKHELTRKDKEDDRTRHTAALNANIGPVFIAYRDVPAIDALFAEILKGAPLYDFVDELDVRHRVWPVEETEKVTALFAGVESAYIADGHHRSASAVRVGTERRAANPNHTGNEEYNWFLSVIFPASQLKILPYNRAVKDLNGLTPDQFLDALKKEFTVECKGDTTYKPTGLHNFSMYLGGKWYSLTAKPGTYNDNDPIGVLDVTILSNLVFDKILNLGDLRTSNRIDFVGGIRGLGELKRRVDSGEMVAAFALYPVSMKQLIDIADTGNIMPPKTTWFEPKLRSGLAIHKF